MAFELKHEKKIDLVILNNTKSKHLFLILVSKHSSFVSFTRKKTKSEKLNRNKYKLNIMLSNYALQMCVPFQS